MASLPRSDLGLLVRTYFDSPAGWASLRAAVGEAPESLGIEIVDDPLFNGAAPETLIASLPGNDGLGALYVADEHAMTSPDHSLLVLPTTQDVDKRFRCLAVRLHDVDTNLRLGNLDWADFGAFHSEQGSFGAEQATRPRQVDHAVAAYRQGSTDLLTLTVPASLWGAIGSYLREGFADYRASAQARQLAERIYDRATIAPIMRRDDPVVVTMEQRAWLFVRARASRIESQAQPGDPVRFPGVGGLITEFLNDELR